MKKAILVLTMSLMLLGVAGPSQAQMGLTFEEMVAYTPIFFSLQEPPQALGLAYLTPNYAIGAPVDEVAAYYGYSDPTLFTDNYTAQIVYNLLANTWMY